MSSHDFIRNTRQRKIILESLRKRFDHPSADMVYADVRRKIPRISLSTVYRNLEILHDMGMVEKIDIGSGLARYDGNPHPHYHAVCLACSRVDDVPDEAVTAFEYDREKIAGFELSGLVVQFVGMCPKCCEKRSLNGQRARTGTAGSESVRPERVEG